MRKFLFQTIKTLHLLTGLKQFQTLEAKKDKEGIKIWLDSLEAVCRQYGKIPDETKQKIISRNLVQDHDYTGLNARTLNKWFYAYWENKGAKQFYYENQKMGEIDEANICPPDKVKKYVEQIRKNIESIENNATNNRGSQQKNRPDWYNEDFKNKQQQYLNSKKDE